MNPASRTPEGTPNRCPVCGKLAWIEPSLPQRDAPCPHCGHLLWFAEVSADLVPPEFAELFPDWRRRARRQPSSESYGVPFTRFDRVTWAVIAALSTLVVLLNDGLVLTTALWPFTIVVFGQIVLPFLFRCGRQLYDRNLNFYLGALLGWGLVAGPFIGVLFGVLLPCIYDDGITSFVGGLLGLIVGPCFAALEGLVIALIVDTVAWFVTGSSLSRRGSC